MSKERLEEINDLYNKEMYSEGKSYLTMMDILWLIERAEKFEVVIDIFKNGGEYWLDEMEGEMSDE